MAIDTDPLLDPHGGYYFSLEIDKTEIAHFQECSGLKTSTEVFEIEEGGLVAHTHKRPGYAKWENIVLKRGLSASTEFTKWRDEFMFVPEGRWEENKKSGAIVVRAMDGSELRRYSLNKCWPVSWEGPSLNSGGSEVAIETIEIAHEGIKVEDKKKPTGGKPGAAGGSEGHSGGRVEGGGAPTADDQPAGPAFQAGLFGIDMTQAENQGMTELIVEDHVEMLGSCRAVINHGSFDWSQVKLGDDVTAQFGGHADMLFTGVCSGFRHFNKKRGNEYVEVQALDPLVKLKSSRHTRFWEDAKDSDIASEVLGDAGVDSGTVDSTSATHKYVLQRNESDLHFLKRLAARNGYLLTSDHEGKIEFKKPQFSGSAIELERDALFAFDWTMSTQGIPTGLTVYGWNYIDKEMVSHTASGGDVVGIGGGSNGVDESGLIWQEDAYISDVWVSDPSAAEAIAVGELNRLARGFVRGRGVTQGRGDIRAGAKIKFKGFATGFNPEAWVVGSRHRIAGGMYTTEFFFVSNTKPE